MVLFRVIREENYFEIEIQNDGYLIPLELREKIFEPFFRIKETETQKGTGIGLALALTLTQLHKGTLELREPKNNRNVFVLHLPIQIENNFPTQNNDTKKIEKHTLNLYQWNLLF
jgi:signal transduction histidine kinase